MSDSGSHATARDYFLILVVLAVITALEVATYYMPYFQTPENHGVLFWTLVVMSVAKFVLVVGWYMHLRYDHSYYTRVFAIPLVFATAMVVVVMMLTASMHRPL